jgi:hypothetical protein
MCTFTSVRNIVCESNSPHLKHYRIRNVLQPNAILPGGLSRCPRGLFSHRPHRDEARVGAQKTSRARPGAPPRCVTAA